MWGHMRWRGHALPMISAKISVSTLSRSPVEKKRKHHSPSGIGFPVNYLRGGIEIFLVEYPTMQNLQSALLKHGVLVATSCRKKYCLCQRKRNSIHYQRGSWQDNWRQLGYNGVGEGCLRWERVQHMISDNWLECLTVGLLWTIFWFKKNWGQGVYNETKQKKNFIHSGTHETH